MNSIKSYRKYRKYRKGSTLVFVLIIFLVLSILLASINIMFNSNLAQAVRQEKMMEAHYLALSGIEAAKSTLLMPLTVKEGKDINMIEYIKSNPKNYSSFKDNITVNDREVEIIVRYDDSKKDLYITSIATLDDKVKKQIELRLDVRTKKYVEHWE